MVIIGNFFDSSVKKVWAYTQRTVTSRDKGFVLMPIGVFYPVIYAPFDLEVTSFADGHYTGNRMQISYDGLEFECTWITTNGHIPYPSPFNGGHIFPSQSVAAGSPIGMAICKGTVVPHQNEFSSEYDYLNSNFGFNLLLKNYSANKEKFNSLFPFITELSETPTLCDFTSTLQLNGVIFDYMPCDNNVHYIDIVQPGSKPDVTSMDYDDNFNPALHTTDCEKYPVNLIGFREKEMIWDYELNDWKEWDGVVPKGVDRVFVYTKRNHPSVKSYTVIKKSHIFGETTDYDIAIPNCVQDGDPNGVMKMNTYFGYYVPTPLLNVSYGKNISLCGWCYCYNTYCSPSADPVYKEDVNYLRYPYGAHLFIDGSVPLTCLELDPDDHDAPLSKYFRLATDFNSYTVPTEYYRWYYMPEVQFVDEWQDALHQMYLVLDVESGIDERLSVNFAEKFTLDDHYYWGIFIPLTNTSLGKKWTLAHRLSHSEYEYKYGFCTGECQTKGYLQAPCIIIKAGLRNDGGMGDIIPILCYLAYRKYGKVTGCGISHVLNDYFRLTK